MYFFDSSTVVVSNFNLFSNLFFHKLRRDVFINSFFFFFPTKFKQTSTFTSTSISTNLLLVRTVLPVVTAKKFINLFCPPKSESNVNGNYVNPALVEIYGIVPAINHVCVKCGSKFVN